MLHAPITYLKSHTNDPITLGDDDIVVFIGPNNVGKSRMIAGLYARYGYGVRSRLRCQVLPFARSLHTIKRKMQDLTPLPRTPIPR